MVLKRIKDNFIVTLTLTYLLMCQLFHVFMNFESNGINYRTYVDIYKQLSFVLIGLIIFYFMVKFIFRDNRFALLYEKTILVIYSSFTLWFITLYSFLFLNSQGEKIIFYLLMDSIGFVLAVLLLLYIRKQMSNNLENTSKRFEIKDFIRFEKSDIVYLIAILTKIIVLYSFVITYVFILFKIANYYWDE